MKKWLLKSGEFFGFALLTMAMLLIANPANGVGLRAFILQHGCTPDALNLSPWGGLGFDYCGRSGPDGIEIVDTWWQQTRFLTRAMLSFSVAMASALIARVAFSTWSRNARLLAYISVPGVAFAIASFMALQREEISPSSLGLGLGGLVGVFLGSALLWPQATLGRLRLLVTPGALVTWVVLLLIGVAIIAGEVWRQSDAHYVELLPHDRFGRSLTPEGVIAVAKSNHFGVLSPAGNWLIEPSFEKIEKLASRETKTGLFLHGILDGKHYLYWIKSKGINQAGPFSELMPLAHAGQFLAKTESGRHTLAFFGKEKLETQDIPFAYDSVHSPETIWDTNSEKMITALIATRQNKTGLIAVESRIDSEGPGPVAELIPPAAHALRWAWEPATESPKGIKKASESILIASEGNQWVYVTFDGRLAKMPQLFDQAVSSDSPEAQAELKRFLLELKQ